MRDSSESSPCLMQPAGVAGLLGGVAGVTDGAAGFPHDAVRGVAGVAKVIYWTRCTCTATRREKRKTNIFDAPSFSKTSTFRHTIIFLLFLSFRTEFALELYKQRGDVHVVEDIKGFELMCM